MQLYITSYNRTTNEDGKWTDIRKWHKKQQKKYKEAVKKGLVKPSSNDESTTTAAPELKDGDVSCTGGGSSIAPGGDQPEYFDPGPLPKNIYDRGFVENWKEVLFPISLRKDAYELGGYSRPERMNNHTESKPATVVSSLPMPSDKSD